MNGIYFINDRISIGGLTREESSILQEQAIKKHLEEQSIQIVTLNPYQLKEYYSVPHALLYDLHKANTSFDYFIYYSQQAVEEFINSYPAKWLILKSYFNNTIMIKKQTDFEQQQAI
ncbi:hypothetical protein L1999_11565 [Neobacillus drentensis]|uniref:hypothetical protein n=1 Tax=Neobacillus drentensis TaxID=220684 RepID=UPI001F168031|nr:hypothetical protein [Neobacillus drentensis]ULT59116.1 hypothetical protein L1999_11565 [Neobacillus drentensis]